MKNLKQAERQWWKRVGNKILYRFCGRAGSGYIFQQQMQRMMELVPKLDTGTVMEVGYGQGYLLKELQRQLSKQVKLVGLDITPPGKKVRQRLKGVSLIEGDGEQLPFKSGVFEVLLYMGSLHHLPDYIQGVKEAVRVLKKSGVVIIFEPFSTPFTRFVHRVMDRLFFKGGVVYESPVDLLCKNKFRSSSVVGYLKRRGFKLKWQSSDFLAYPLTSCYAGGGLSNSALAAKWLYTWERVLVAIPGLKYILRPFCWRGLVSAHQLMNGVKTRLAEQSCSR